MGANAPPPHGPKRSAGKEPKTKEKNVKDESFLLICQRTQHKQCRKHTRGCWSLITVHVIDQYLSRPINGPNTIMRKGWLAVVFLYWVFLKTMKLHSQVKSLLKTFILTYITIIWHILFPITPTHFLLFLPHLVTELKISARPTWRNDRTNFERCVRVDRPIFWKIHKNIETFIQIITRL